LLSLYVQEWKRSNLVCTQAEAQLFASSDRGITLKPPSENHHPCHHIYMTMNMVEHTDNKDDKDRYDEVEEQSGLPPQHVKRNHAENYQCHHYVQRLHVLLDCFLYCDATRSGCVDATTFRTILQGLLGLWPPIPKTFHIHDGITHLVQRYSIYIYIYSSD
jgi:hypothetical protein